MKRNVTMPSGVVRTNKASNNNMYLFKDQQVPQPHQTPIFDI